ncbi:hypothetical protein Tco_0428109 [Tanacetum coccineum]
MHTRQETRNLGLKKITDDKGPVPIWFEWDDKKTLMPLGDHASHWSNYLGELIREMPLNYPSWQKVPTERKTQFDLTPHMQSQRWTDINAGIQQHLQKLYNTNKASLKATHWVINHTKPGMYYLFRSDDKFSQILSQYESTPEFGNASESGMCRDGEMADDEDGDEDEADEEDGDS